MAHFVLVPGAGGSAWYWSRLVPELRARGHDAVLAQHSAVFGRGQAIWRLDPQDTGSVLVAGSEPRADGYPLGW